MYRISHYRLFIYNRTLLKIFHFSLQITSDLTNFQYWIKSVDYLIPGSFIVDCSFVSIAQPFNKLRNKRRRDIFGRLWASLIPLKSCQLLLERIQTPDFPLLISRPDLSSRFNMPAITRQLATLLENRARVSSGTFQGHPFISHALFSREFIFFAGGKMRKRISMEYCCDPEFVASK